MIKHQLLQGSTEWLAYRKNYNNASDAPAMLGESAYKTRTELQTEVKTGLVPEISSATQKLFDMGHKSEALARPLAEKIIGEELSPEVGSLGDLSASFDGITFMGDVIFEHKALNEKIRACMSADDLDEQYKIQMEQQLYISKADKCLFMATKWQETNEVTVNFITLLDGSKQYFNLIEAFDCYYFPNAERRQRIIDGWAQFEKDLETYVPPVIVEKVEAETIQALPVPSVVVRGEIVASNLDEITPMFDRYLSEINYELTTDQHFADAKANAKNCGIVEDQIQSQRDSMISQMVTVKTIDSVLANYQEAFRKTRLHLDKAVKEQELSIKSNAVLATKQSYMDHVQALEAEIAPIRLNLVVPDFAGSFKNVKSLDTMHSRLNDALASGKIAADAAARDIRTKLVWYNNYTDYKFLFSDLQSIIGKPLDDFMLLVESRVESHKHAELAKEAKIKAEAEAALLAKVEADRIAAMVAEAAKLPTMSNNEVKEQFDHIASVGKEIRKSVPSPELRAVVVEKQDVIASFFKTHNINPDKFHEYRAVIVEFIKFDTAYNIKQAA